MKYILNINSLFFYNHLQQLSEIYDCSNENSVFLDIVYYLFSIESWPHLASKLIRFKGGHD